MFAAYQYKNETSTMNFQVQIIQNHSQYLRFSQTQWATSYVGRVLHPPLKEITVTLNLMQSSVGNFSVSIVKYIPQNKKNIVVCCKNTRKTKGTQLTKKYNTPVSLKYEVSLKSTTEKPEILGKCHCQFLHN